LIKKKQSLEKGKKKKKQKGEEILLEEGTSPECKVALNCIDKYSNFAYQLLPRPH